MSGSSDKATLNESRVIPVVMVDEPEGRRAQEREIIVRLEARETVIVEKPEAIHVRY